METPIDNPSATVLGPLRIDELRLCYERLGRRLIEAGKTPAEATRLVETQVSARCNECGFVMTGTELAEAAVISPAVANVSSKLVRLRMGDCARRGCTSLYCELRFLPTPGIDWELVWHSTLARLEAPDPIEPPDATAVSFWTSLEARYGRGRSVLLLFVVAAAATTLWLSVRDPVWARGEPKFEAEPETIFEPARSPERFRF